MKKVIPDATAGRRMMWLQKRREDTVFLDKRREVKPDIVADFRQLPFKDSIFDLVLFDPPHLSTGETGVFRRKFGTINHFTLGGLYHASRELFRVLKNSCFLIFKWNTHDYSVKQVLQYWPWPPLFGQRTTGRIKYRNVSQTWWFCFIKE